MKNLIQEGKKKAISELKNQFLNWDQKLQLLEEELSQKFDKVRRDYRDQLADIHQVRLELHEGLEKLQHINKREPDLTEHLHKGKEERLWQNIANALEGNSKELANTKSSLSSN